ncbi:MAG TPA: hypothetical protein PLU10_05900 [Chitinophagaceae bacterium]|nr:hypothetical protein [Chitinophagaceae bacterium]
MESTFELQENHLKYLKEILSRRKSLFYGSLGGLPFLFFVYFDRAFIKLSWDEIKQDILNRDTWFWLTTLIIVGVTAGAFLNVYFQKIRKLEKDIRERTGIIQYSMVSRSTHFPHTNQFYLFFEDVRFPNKEVTPFDFEKYTPGTLYPISYSYHSRILFDEFGNFDVL